MDFKNFVGTAYDLRNTQYSCQTLKNWWLEVQETSSGKGSQPAQLTQRFGMPAVITGLAGGSRGGYVASNGTLFWVFGSTLYTISTAPSATARGNIGGGTSPVIFTDNGTDLFMVAGNAIYIYNLATATISNPASGSLYSTTASSCTFLDNYVVFTKPSSNQFFWTDLTSTTGDVLNFASAEANPDRIVACINNSQSLWIFGRKTTEIWTSNNSAQTSAQAFVRQGNALIETGCAAAHTVKKINQTIAWLATDDRGAPMMVLGQGYGAPERISTFPLEQKWLTYTSTDIQNASGEVIQWGGHFFYILNFPNAEETFVYDMTTSQMMGRACWHTWNSFDGNGSFTRNIGQGFLYFSGYYVTGDYAEGNLCILSMTENFDVTSDRSVIVERTSPHLSAEMKTIFHSQLIFDFATGTTEVQSLDPQVMMQFSDDGGKTWSDERWESCGRIGEYQLKVQFDQLGSTNSRVYRIRGSDDQYWALSGASIDVEPGLY